MHRTRRADSPEKDNVRDTGETNRIETLRQKLDLTQRVMARILGVTERTVIDLEAGRALSEGIGRRVMELDRLRRDLSKVVRPEAIGRWLLERSIPGCAQFRKMAAGR